MNFLSKQKIKQCFWDLWREKYKNFYLFTTKEPDEFAPAANLRELDFVMKHDNGMKRHSRWYPSEEEPITAYQKQFLGPVKINARKAEFMIEDYAIRQAIYKYFLPKKLSNTMEIDWQRK
jgi:hypothetical protein